MPAVSNRPSSFYPLNTDVPQGSVLYFTLYLLFINTYRSCSSNSTHSYVSTYLKSLPSYFSSLSNSIFFWFGYFSHWGSLSLNSLSFEDSIILKLMSRHLLTFLSLSKVLLSLLLTIKIYLDIKKTVLETRLIKWLQKSWKFCSDSDFSPFLATCIIQKSLLSCLEYCLLTEGRLKAKTLFPSLLLNYIDSLSLPREVADLPLTYDTLLG